MNINSEIQNNTIKQLNKIISKYYDNTISLEIEKGIRDFTKEYININNTPSFLSDAIYNENANKIISLLEKLIQSTHIRDILDNYPYKLAYMNDEELNPEKYIKIIEKKEIQNLLNSKVNSSTFKCNKCKSDKISTSQRQTRSGDEPPSTFITCLDCGNVVKIG